jgi:hypothetical protein
MATIKFSINVSGGMGNIHIHLVNSITPPVPPVDVDLDTTATSKTVDLSPGLYTALAGGNVPNSPGGEIDLLVTVVTGNITPAPPALDHKFTAAGAPINPFSFSFYVN